MADILTIFDLDGTLIEFHRVAVSCPICGGTTRVPLGKCAACVDGIKPFHNQETYDIVSVLPNRYGILAHLRAEGHALAIATNQTDVAFGRITPKQISDKMKLVEYELGSFDAIKIATGHPGAPHPYNEPALHSPRKPSPAILLDLLNEFQPKDVLFVGDTDKDRQAAEAAGIDYMNATNFFTTGWKVWITEANTRLEQDQTSRV